MVGTNRTSYLWQGLPKDFFVLRLLYTVINLCIAHFHYVFISQLHRLAYGEIWRRRGLRIRLRPASPPVDSISILVVPSGRTAAAAAGKHRGRDQHGRDRTGIDEHDMVELPLGSLQGPPADLVEDRFIMVNVPSFHLEAVTQGLFLQIRTHREQGAGQTEHISGFIPHRAGGTGRDPSGGVGELAEIPEIVGAADRGAFGAVAER